MDNKSPLPVPFQVTRSYERVALEFQYFCQWLTPKGRASIAECPRAERLADHNERWTEIERSNLISQLALHAIAQQHGKAVAHDVGIHVSRREKEPSARLPQGLEQRAAFRSIVQEFEQTMVRLNETVPGKPLSRGQRE